jgi:hypothetical protein
VRVVADMDTKTTPICRSLNGRLIPIAHIKAQIDKIKSANSVGDMIAARDMSITSPIYGALPANIGIPPYHFNCRTDIVADRARERKETLSGARSPLTVLSDYRRGDSIDFSGKEKTIRFAMVDSTGHVRVVTNETYDHPSASNSKKPPENKIHAALNSIMIEADNLRDGTPNGRTIALSDNNIILILDGLEVITIIDPKGAKAAKDYFNAHSVPATRQKINTKVRKWANRLMRWAKETFSSI